MTAQWIDNALDSVGRNMRAAGREPLGYRKSGRPIWPVFGAEDNGGEGGSGSGEGGGSGSGGSQGGAGGDAAGYPAGTAVEQMTAPQQAAYWKDQSRRHEQRNRAYGNATPEQIKEWQEKAKKQDELEVELGTTADKAAAKAADEARKAAEAESLPQIITAKLDAAAARAGVSEEDLTKALEFVDNSKFLDKGGKVDTDRVKAFIASITPARGNDRQQQRGPSGAGAGRQHTNQTGTAADRGLAEAQRRFGKKSA